MANARRILKSKKSSLRGIGIFFGAVAAAPLKEDQDPAGFGRGFLCLPAPPASKQRRSTCASQGTLAAADHAVPRRRARRAVVAAAGPALSRTAGRRADPRRHHRRGLDARRRRDRAAGRNRGSRGRAAHPDLSRRVGKFYPQGRRDPRRDRRLAGRRLPHRLPVLHAAVAGRASIGISPRSPTRRGARSSSTTSRTAPA